VEDLPSNMFQGKPCRVCGGTIRYATRKPSGRCVACAKQGERNRAEARRKAAKLSPENTFTGKPCRKCSNRIRYIITGKCIECQKVAVARSRIKNRQKYTTRYKGRYKNKLYNKSATRQMLGICDDSMTALLALQQGVCAICKKAELSNKALAVDHCHKTGRFRGLLCRKCNTGLGFFNDDPDLLEAAKNYLKNNDWLL
jgi:hypothetical protein